MRVAWDVHDPDGCCYVRVIGASGFSRFRSPDSKCASIGGVEYDERLLCFSCHAWVLRRSISLILFFVLCPRFCCWLSCLLCWYHWWKRGDHQHPCAVFEECLDVYSCCCCWCCRSRWCSWWRHWQWSERWGFKHPCILVKASQFHWYIYNYIWTVFSLYNSFFSSSVVFVCVLAILYYFFFIFLFVLVVCPRS